MLREDRTVAVRNNAAEATRRPLTGWFWPGASGEREGER